LDANAISSKKLIMIKDTIVKSVLDKYKQRSEVGIKKYNQTMDRDDLNLLDWLTHLQEELMDATLYVEKLKQEFKKK
jgi:succinate dehydrogenase flavin-adding protein (antitoxin of CptAB toxin-antitoxin module)